ncbi:MAG: hypothetical protein M1829_003625 [Trizodia sp. TS-e1964]|nr:MAG: hypothetical protein M1829_003625 [Trizodia sp. TS-e1964]
MHFTALPAILLTLQMLSITCASPLALEKKALTSRTTPDFSGLPTLAIHIMSFKQLQHLERDLLAVADASPGSVLNSGDLESSLIEIIQTIALAKLEVNLAGEVDFATAAELAQRLERYSDAIVLLIDADAGAKAMKAFLLNLRPENYRRRR